MKKVPSKSEDLVCKILTKKMELERAGKNPRVVLLDIDSFFLLDKKWMSDTKGSSYKDIFSEERTLFGLMVITVDTISGFEVR